VRRRGGSFRRAAALLPNSFLFLDEGFHLLAAQLIMSGKRPIWISVSRKRLSTPTSRRDGCALRRHLARGARSPGSLGSGCGLPHGGFHTLPFPRSRWRLAGAVAAAVAVGMNSQVVLFGTIGQSYGLCLFLIVAAYRLAVVAVEREGASPASAPGSWPELPRHPLC